MKTHTILFQIGVWLIFIGAPWLSKSAFALDQVYDIEVQFSFDAQPPAGVDVSGYRLYKDGTALCEESGSGAQTLNCAVDTPGAYDFTLSVLYTDGSESPQSAPYEFVVTDEMVAIYALQVLSGQNPADADQLGNIAETSRVEMSDVIRSLRQSAL